MQSEYGFASPQGSTPNKAASPPYRDSRYFEEDYHVEGILGEGTYSVVRRCINKANGAARAVKIIFKDEMRDGEIEQVRKEVEILSNLDH